MATGYWGTSAGPGAKYRTYIEFDVTQQGEDSAYVRMKYSIHVDNGDFKGTVVRKSWGGSATLYGTGWYGDSGWQNVGWVKYGSSVTKTSYADYTGYSGSYYKSTCSATFKPSAPTWQPKAVTNQAAKLSGSSAVVSWTNNPTTARPYSSIQLDRQVDGGSWAALATLSGTTATYTDTSVKPNHSYRYRITPKNSAASATAALTGTVSAAPNAPAAPTSVTNTRNSDSKNTVAWTNNPTDAAPYADVLVERKVDGGSWSQVATVTGASYTDTNTSANHYYAYRVRAHNASGYSPYATSGTTYNTPCAPGTPKGSRTGETSVTIAFTNAANTATATEVQRSTDTKTWTTVGTTSGMATGYSDNPGGGTFYYRVRNTRGGLASAWSAASDAVVTICAPAAPTLTSPTSGEVVPTSQAAITFKWTHNAIDGSAQTAAQLQWSTDGSTWVTLTATTAQTLAVANSFAVNSTVYWRVRTKGVHADWGPWSGNRTFHVRQAPAVSITSPGQTVEEMPMTVGVQYVDASGSLAALTLSITDLATGSEVWSKDAGKSTSVTVARSELLLEDGGSYRITATARSTSQLQTVATAIFAVDFILPKMASLRVEADPDRGWATLKVIVDETGTGADVESMSVWRSTKEGLTLLAEDVADGSEVTDRFCPLNVEFSYLVTAYAYSGASRTVESHGSVKTPYTFFYFPPFGEDEMARYIYDPTESIALARAQRTLVRYAGRKYPVAYDAGGTDDTRSVSGYLTDAGEEAKFRELMEHGLAVYKGVGGDVFWCVADIAIEPQLLIPGGHAQVSGELTRVDGDRL